MQVRSAARPIAVARAAAAPAAQAAVQPTAVKPAATGKTNDMLQQGLFGAATLSTLIALPAAIAKVVSTTSAGLVNVMFGGWNAYKDAKGLKDAGNAKKGDDYMRLGGDAALIAGGAAMLGGALVAPWLPLAGVGVAVGGYLLRAIGIGKDDTRS